MFHDYVTLFYKKHLAKVLFLPQSMGGFAVIYRDDE